MLRKPHMVVIALVAATSAGLVLTDAVKAAKPPATSPGTAVFRDAEGDTIANVGDDPYIGTFDRDGNFSFDTGSQRAVDFNFGDSLALFGGSQAPAGSTIPESGPTSQVGFRTLTSAGSGGLTTVLVSGVRSVRFSNGVFATTPTTVSQGGAPSHSALPSAKDTP